MLVEITFKIIKMKQTYRVIKTKFIFLILIYLSQHIYAQCIISHDQNGVNLNFNDNTLLRYGQGFTAECDGNLEYVQFIANSTGTLSAGVLKIYSGNNTNNSPIYNQSYQQIIINSINDPVRININENLMLINDNQYIFEFEVNNINLLADLQAGYSGGSAYEFGDEIQELDFLFDVSIIAEPTLSTESINYKKKEVLLFPNPSSNYIKISNLDEKENFIIYSALGKEIKNGFIYKNQSIDIKNFMNGLYFLKLSNGFTINFIKK